MAAENEDWQRLLSSVGRDPDQSNSFIARNFLLDEGVLPERAGSYRDVGCTAAHADFGEWKIWHEKYLKTRVALETNHQGPPPILDQEESAECPETFQLIDEGSPFLGTEGNVYLVRVETLDFFLSKIAEEAETVKRLIRVCLSDEAKSSQEEVSNLDALLRSWFEELDQRPVYAGFWSEVSDFFGEEPGADVEGWADQLRDRLGLAHLNPPDWGSDSIEILVFRYPVHEIPRLKGIRRRPLVTPTVLDGPFSEAFCPSPRNSTTGHAVHLDPQRGILRREVLHPRFPFQTSHLWRFGRIEKGITRRQLIDGRALHLLHIRDEANREDYAEGTDGDLF